MPDNLHLKAHLGAVLFLGIKTTARL